MPKTPLLRLFSPIASYQPVMLNKKKQSNPKLLSETHERTMIYRHLTTYTLCRDLFLFCITPWVHSPNERQCYRDNYCRCNFPSANLCTKLPKSMGHQNDAFNANATTTNNDPVIPETSYSSTIQVTENGEAGEVSAALAKRRITLPTIPHY